MRGLSVAVAVGWYSCIVVVRLTVDLLLKKPKMGVIVGECIASAAEHLGGAFVKAGQILSTRGDLLPSDTIAALGRLRDNVRPLQYRDIEGVLQQLQDSEGNIQIAHVDMRPLASATIAQVHVGTEGSTGKTVVLKVRRPGIAGLLKTDVSYIRFFARILACLPWFRRLPICEATDEICCSLLRQSDFVEEVKMTHRFRCLFRGNPHVCIPATIDCLCTDDVIVMEYLSEYRTIQEFRERGEVAKTALLTGLRALYKMIFGAGLVHCDLHAGNILAKADGTIALLDFGFVAEMTPKSKQDFAEFFLSIAFRDSKTAAWIVKETALRIGKNFDLLAFERDMQELIADTAGRRAAEFQVAGFVYRLFQIQAKHGIYGSPHFTLPILSLLTYEGLIKDIYPEIDFQQEAVPVLIEALAAKAP